MVSNRPVKFGQHRRLAFQPFNNLHLVAGLHIAPRHSGGQRKSVQGWVNQVAARTRGRLRKMGDGGWSPCRRDSGSAGFFTPTKSQTISFGVRNNWGQKLGTEEKSSGTAEAWGTTFDVLRRSHNARPVKRGAKPPLGSVSTRHASFNPDSINGRLEAYAA